MIIGKVVGRLWSTRKDERLNGQKFLVIRPMRPDKRMGENYFVAADIIGAGNGDMVLVTNGGSARRAVGGKDVPIDATIIGIVDSIEVDDE